MLEVLWWHDVFALLFRTLSPYTHWVDRASTFRRVWKPRSTRWATPRHDDALAIPTIVVSAHHRQGSSQDTGPTEPDPRAPNITPVSRVKLCAYHTCLGFQAGWTIFGPCFYRRAGLWLIVFQNGATWICSVYPTISGTESSNNTQYIVVLCLSSHCKNTRETLGKSSFSLAQAASILSQIFMLIQASIMARTQWLSRCNSLNEN